MKPLILSNLGDLRSTTPPSPYFGCPFAAPDGGDARLDVVLTENPFSDAALDAVPDLRTLARQAAVSAGLHPSDVLIGGDTAEAADTRTAGNRDSVVVLPLVLLAIGVVLALLLRSLIVTLYLMATIAFTYFATLGLAVLVFQAAFDHVDVGSAAPFFLFVFLNALSVDYNIYLMSRIREEARRAPLGVLIDAFVARTLIVPALVSIFGRWNWWPSRIERA